ncbi:bifunctional metallophosphatase/5'-nucleotidase [Ligilactobacillus cholophilus]|uniref:bifunctional metallophosphatase/5'-nucleotidase n=1 Tax=Ligilactobacillus cholophilus TaxID=3050131 RepID=UPI0025B0C66B|nr:bifunctional UDP-sugar hydrolase/5'-nucleotidase [Ligilactobacillus cholophilus]
MKIKILSTSDVHGYIYPTNFSTRDDHHALGYLKAASVIEDVQRQAEKDGDIAIYIEDGDFVEGSPMTDYAYQTRDEKHYNLDLVRMVNHLQADVGILGNHEFNYGPDYLNPTLADRTYPILNANMQEDPASHIIDAPYKIIEKNNIKIAVLGLTTQYIPHWEQPKHIEGWKFEPAFEAAAKYVPELRKQADVVIVAYHGGFERDLQTGEPTEALTGENEGYQIITEVPGIDAFVTGHQHRQIAAKVNGIPTTQPGFRGEKVGCITLTLDDNKKVVDSSAELLDVADAGDEMWMNALTYDWNHDVQDWLDQRIATIDGDMEIHDPMEARLHGHPYLEFVNQVEMDAMGTDIAATALFNNEVTGLGHDVTIRNVMNSYVYPNTLVTEAITGKDLRNALERCASFFELQPDGSLTVSKDFSYPKMQLYNYDFYSGIDYTFDLTQPKGKRVVELKYHDKDVQDTDELKVTMNQYRGVGGGNYDCFSADKIIKQNETEVPRLLIAYLENHPNIKAIQPTNLKIIK